MLDEWIYFLKNSEVGDDFKAKGLDKAKEKLRYEELSEEDKRFYNCSTENRRIEMSVEYTKELEVAFEKEQAELDAKQGKAIEIAKNLIGLGCDNEFIIKATGLNTEQIDQLSTES